jgi:E3 ubiquitin ligase
MTVWLSVIGVALAVAAAIFFWFWRAKRNDAALMQATETTPAGDVAALPPGTQVEVKGTLRCAEPVTGHLSQQPCAHFVASVEREYTYYKYENGKRRRVRGSETVERHSSCCAFEVVDESGAILVRPDEATVEGVVAVQRYEPYKGDDGGSFAAAALNALTRNEQTHGFRYVESHLPIGAPVYILGVTGEGAIGTKPKRGQSFIISTKSEEARAAELAKGAKWMLGLGVGGLSGALLCLGAVLWTL